MPPTILPTLFTCVSLFTLCSSVHYERMDAQGSTPHLVRKQKPLHQHPHKQSQKQTISSSIIPSKKPLVLYGVIASYKPNYLGRVVAQVGTWAAKPLEEGRFFAVAGNNIPLTDKETSRLWFNPSNKSLPRRRYVTTSPCSDHYAGIPCKEAQLLQMGFNQSGDWLWRADDDSYVDTEALEKALGALDTKEPMVVGALGCAQGRPGHLDQPMVPGQKVFPKVCPEVTKRGGLCGGSGYGLNRAALRLLFEKGSWKVLEQEYGSIKSQGVGYGDIVTSCVLRKHGIDMKQLAGIGSGNRVHAVKAWERELGQFYTYHYATPDVMYWVHAKLHHAKEKEVKKLQDKAFDHGCCCFLKETEKGKCQAGLLEETSFTEAREAVYQSFLELGS